MTNPRHYFSDEGWLATAGSLLLPSAALKYFAPDFTLRDPLVSLVRRSREKGQNCALALFHLENFSRLHPVVPEAQMKRLYQEIRGDLRILALEQWSDTQIIAAGQLSEADFALFVAMPSSEPAAYRILQDKTRKIQEALISCLSARFPEISWLNILAGSFVLDPPPVGAQAAISLAYQYALALATKKLPGTFYRTREDLETIIREERISVLAQPIMQLRTGDLYGWEILSRGPENTMFYAPSELFELAHQTDLLYQMELLVVKKALEEIAQREIHEQVFINITALSLGNPVFLENILKQMARFPEIVPTQIVWELTERHAIRDFRHIGEMMRRYRDHGFRFAMDDAGSGYSSLQSISELIPDIIKLDRSLIQNIDQISVKQSLLKALLYFADNINCRVIAEGVEREEEAEILFQHEVEMGQGYYFAKPEPLRFKHERSHLDELASRIKYRIDHGRAFA